MGSFSGLGKFFLGAFVLLAFISFSYAVTTNPCSDGTLYGQCSSATPGKYCTGISSAPSLVDGASLCPCPSGYATEGDVCVAQTCPDGTAYNSCATGSSKGKICENGALVDRSSVCGCPTNYHVEGETCALDTGCIYNKVTCPPEKYCESERSSSNYNTCVQRAGCQYNNPACTSSQICSADGTCKLKNGCTYNNPACSSEQICRNNECVDRSAFDIINPGDAPTNSTATGSTGNSLACCCLPAAGGLVTLAGAFAIRRKKEE